MVQQQKLYVYLHILPTIIQLEKPDVWCELINREKIIQLLSTRSGENLFKPKD